MKLGRIILLGLLAAGSSATGQTSHLAVTEGSIRSDMQLHVCKDRDRLEAVKRLFRTKGALDADLKVEALGKVDNLLIVKKGKTTDTIVVGAHYDKVPDGCGTIDNWTGIVVLANIFGTLRKVETDKTIVFAAFGKEEDGLVGSRAMAKAIPKEKRTQYCAMINFDSFGLYYPQVLSNSSNTKMAKFAKELASEVKMRFSEASLAGVADSDSSSFLDHDIPAITFHGLSSRWTNYVHTANDKLDNVNHQAVLIAYNFGILYLSRVDALPCNAFRKT